jgi:uncharacterized repeat protein (TIGR01451 family)
MRKLMLTISNIVAATALSATTGIATALSLTPFSNTFPNPVGIDWYEPTSQLIMSVNYPNGSPNNLDLVTLGTGVFTPWSTLANQTEEVKVATVRSSPCQQTFAVGDAFTGNGNFGQIVKIDAVTASVTNPWLDLNQPPGTEPALIRGSLFQDRFCVAGGDLIVVTGIEEDGTSTDFLGNVWRVNSAKVATKVATLNKHLEGVTTVPNDPTTYGPLAGRIIVGDEDFIGAPACTGASDPSICNGSNGKIFAVNPNATDDYFTIGSGAGVAGHMHYQTTINLNPEDLDIIRSGAAFFGVATRNGQILTASAVDFDGRCGHILVTQEFPFPGTSGLSALRWDATGNGGLGGFIVERLTSNLDGQIQQWEHVTFSGGKDCATRLTITKDPKNAIFNIGQQLSFTIVVTNAGGAPVVNATLSDPLPTTGGLTWTVTSVTPAAPCSIDGSQTLNCSFGTLALGASETVVMTTNNVGGAPPSACTGQKLNNVAAAVADNALAVQDLGDYTCTPQPPQLTVAKSPKAGTFTQGGQTSFTIVVSNPAPAGSSSATNVTLTDQLPGNGGLVWSNVGINPAQGSCTIVANLLSCNLGTIAVGGSVTVTVTSAATAPAAACQDQPNDGTLGPTNLAKATADGGLSAQDIGKLTCTPPPPGGLIAPTETTCQQFASATASTLGQVNYSVSGGKIAQSINPGVFFYYAKITTTVVNTVVTVSESQNDAAALFQIQKDQARLYKGDCSSWTGGTLINGDTGASFTIATPGTYIISIKYSTKSIAGTSAPTSDPVTYTFTATPPGAISSATVLLKKQ